MLFNSIDFAIFLPIVFGLYWFGFQKNLIHQNLVIAVSSYVFYGWWDWRFLSLILFSSLVDFVGAILITNKRGKSRKAILAVSLITNLGLLGFFKYFNFFLDNISEVFSFCGVPLQMEALTVVLPVGISFYTFQTMSYTIDVYRGNLKPTHDFVAFSAYVSFFPQLVAGPIERATNLLPQFQRPRQFDISLAVDGLRQILWGLFKKVVIADNCATIVNAIFDQSDQYSGPILIMGAAFFAIQIYCDFSGYSDMALGLSRLFGFSMMQNFAFPYFSRDIAEFWRRWHISLSTWFRDYLYIPLGGSRGNKWMKIRNTFAIFLVSGFWHGANWTFIFWGLLHALFFLPLLLADKNRVNLDIVKTNRLFFPSITDTIRIASTFALTCIAWIFFRAENIQHALQYVSDMILGMLSRQAYIDGLNFSFWELNHTICALTLMMIAAEWVGKNGQHALENLENRLSMPTRWLAYLMLTSFIVYYFGSEQQFIYFQF